MSITTHTDRDNRLHVVFDDERTAPVERYAIFFEGRDTVVVGRPFESPADVWQRVLDTVADMRAVIRRGAWRGREHYFAFVYAMWPPEPTCWNSAGLKLLTGVGRHGGLLRRF